MVYVMVLGRFLISCTWHPVKNDNDAVTLEMRNEL